MMLLRHLGKENVIWDRAAEIDFIKPGRGDVVAHFAITEADIERLREAASGGAKVLEWFTVEVRDSTGDVVARVRKQVYLRRKRDLPVPGSATSLPSPDQAVR
jgi:hypothetical protein